MPLTRPEKVSKLKQWFNQTELDPKVVKTTIGINAEHITPHVLLESSAKLIKINKKEVQPDDRDNIKYSKFLGLEDMIEEHINRDAGRFQQKAAYKMQMKKNLSWLTPGFFSPQIRSTIIGNTLSANVEGINPLANFDDSHKITKMGPGGIPCYDELTEVLTKKGFKKWPEVKESDKLACLIDGKLEYCKPVKLYKKKYNGTMHGLSSPNLNYLVTPDHNCYVSVRQFNEVGFAFWSAFTFIAAKYLSNLPEDLEVRFKVGLEDEEMAELNRPKDNFYTVIYDSFVYCAEVPGHLLYIKRGEKTMWNGNSIDAIPWESRLVSPSSFAWVDPCHISESERIGVNSYAAHNVAKGNDNKLYRIMLDKDGNKKWMDHEEVANHQVHVPEF